MATVKMRAKMDDTITPNIITGNMAQLTGFDIASTGKDDLEQLSGFDGQKYEIRGATELQYCGENGAETYTETFYVVKTASLDVILGAASKYPKDHGAGALCAIRLRKQSESKKRLLF